MYEATRRSLFFDYLRVPYEVRDQSRTAGHGVDEVRATATGRAFCWPDETALAGVEPRAQRFGGATIFARRLEDEAVRALLAPRGGDWVPTASDGGQATDARIWRSADGDVFVPFAPDEAILACWSEKYEDVARTSRAKSAKRFALGAYYRVRPVLPRRVQIAFRRALRRVQERRAFPRWPYEMSLHDLYESLLDIAAEIAGDVVPWIAPWPHGHRWAFVLTHDVELDLGYRNVHLMRDLEQERDLRSSWNFVPLRYDVDDEVVQALTRDGFEVGVHGLYHDGRDLASEPVLRERLPQMLEYAERWGAVGFRSPATHRQWELMRLLEFDYDSSYPDSDPFEPKGGGCCTWLPFFNGDLVELPITLVQDHTLFVILQRRDEGLWLEKANFLRDRGGMALLITHPDYMLDEERLGAYARFLDAYAEDPTVWRALPRDVAAWWRSRAASEIALSDAGGWEIVGEAADSGRVVLHERGKGHAA